MCFFAHSKAELRLNIFQRYLQESKGDCMSSFVFFHGQQKTPANHMHLFQNCPALSYSRGLKQKNRYFLVWTPSKNVTDHISATHWTRHTNAFQQMSSLLSRWRPLDLPRKTQSTKQIAAQNILRRGERTNGKIQRFFFGELASPK